MPFVGAKKREYERIKRRNMRGIARAIDAQLRVYEALAALIKWSVDGEYSHTSDMFPAFTHSEIIHRFSALRKNGYAEFVTFKECSSHDKWWRVTDDGRRAYEQFVFAKELKRELGLSDGGMAVRPCPTVGSPDRSGSRAVRDALVEVA